MKTLYSIIAGIIAGVLAYWFHQWYLVPLGHVDSTPVKPSEGIFFTAFIAVDAFVLIRVALSDGGDGGGGDCDCTGGAGGVM